MNKIYKIYAVTSLVFLAILAISPFKGYFQEWRKVQREYNRYIQKIPQKIKPAPLALQQIWAKELNRIDRCVTCHVGMDNGDLANAPLPFQSHPAIPHDIEKFGCTICHGGQGLATNYADAHLASEFWDKPVLHDRYLESSCGKCHINENLELTPTLNHGRDLIRDLNCVACHDLPASFSKSFVPSLDGIGSKVISRSWLVRWLRNPQDIQPHPKMPNFKFSDNELEVLADFLMSFKSFPGNARLDSLPEIYRQRKDDDAFIQLGKTRFREARCISCHTIEGRGGHLAPELAGIASKASPAWIYNYLRDPHVLQPGVEMPHYGLGVDETAAVTAYMESEFIDWDAPEDTAENKPPPANFFEQGMDLFNKYNCGGCHSLTSAKVTLNRGPDLRAIGSKKIYQIDFGTSDIPHTLYDYIEGKISSPRAFGESTRMPEYTLGTADRQAIVTALLSFRSDPLPREFVRTVPPQSKYDPQGKVGRIIRDYSCLKCHTINHTGGNIAPDLSIVGSQLQPEWVKRYFKVPYSLRPIQEERMPNLFISEDEIETLTDYFYAVLVDDSISIGRDWDSSAAAIERGKGLFNEKYGCRACHIINGKGGYVGPPLDDSGNRLKPGWVYHWLMNPQKYRPGTLEPRMGMSGNEAKDITAYLMSLKTGQ